MTCPIRRYDNGRVVACDSSSIHYFDSAGRLPTHLHLRSALEWRDDDPWSYDATCPTCGGSQEAEPSPFSDSFGDDLICSDCVDGLLPDEVVALPPFVGATLRHVDTGRTYLAIEHDPDDDTWPGVNTHLWDDRHWIASSRIGPVGKPWQVVARETEAP